MLMLAWVVSCVHLLPVQRSSTSTVASVMSMPGARALGTSEPKAHQQNTYPVACLPSAIVA